MLSTQTLGPAKRRDSTRMTRFRPDIEGMRAIAILLVVANHAWGWPGGGYVGVDVFFVISGYLITRGLLRDKIEHGFVSVSSFYVKRIARLLPAAILVIGVTCILIATIYFPLTGLRLYPQALASLFGVQNWAMVRAGTDYLNPSGVPSPFQHFWSLSLEEQFYAVWPWLLVLVWTLFASRRKSARTVRMIALYTSLVIVGFSLAASVIITNGEPIAAYFVPMTRFWELGVGALLAALGWGLRGTSVPAIALRWTGLALIAASAFLYTAGTPMPGVAAIVPVTGAAFIILAAERADQARGFGRILTSKPALQLGKLSYSWYLWHAPALIFFAAVLHDSWVAPLLGIAVSLVLAALTFKFVEDPLRKLVFWRNLRTYLGSRRVWTRALGIIATAGLLIVLSLWQWKGPLPDVTAKPGPVAELSPFADTATLQSQLRATVDAPDWSEFSAQLNHGAIAGAPQLSCLRDPISGLNTTPEEALANCTTGAEGGRRAIVLGDSIAMSWAPAVEAALGDGWQVSALGLNSCPAALVSVDEKGDRAAYADACSKARATDIDAAIAAKPDLIVVASAEGAFGRLTSGATGDAAVAEWSAGLEKSLDRLRAADAPVVVIGNPPETPATQDCAVRTGKPSDCVHAPSALFPLKTRAEETAVASQSAAGMDVSYIDALDWFCIPGVGCPPGADGVLAKIDHGHLSAEYSTKLGTILRGSLAGKVSDIDG